MLPLSVFQRQGLKYEIPKSDPENLAFVPAAPEALRLFEQIRFGMTRFLSASDLMALRVRQYKIVFAEQRASGLNVWRQPLVAMRIPKMFDLRSDPFEAGEDSIKPAFPIWLPKIGNILHLLNFS
jgi:hypothetical protein